MDPVNKIIEKKVVFNLFYRIQNKFKNGTPWEEKDKLLEELLLLLSFGRKDKGPTFITGLLSFELFES